MNEIIADIEIKWSFLLEEDERWNTLRCLYAYVLPDSKETLYIGKSWGVTVKGRWNRSAKENFWDDLESLRGIQQHAVLLGEPYLPPRKRLTHQLLADVESLLIMAEQPWGNIQSMKSRIERPGLVVHCSGDWLGKSSHYKDGV